MYVNRAMRWSLAVFFMALIVGVAYVGTTFFTREHKIERMENQQRNMRGVLDTVERKTQILERRIVELETQIENLKGR